MKKAVSGMALKNQERMQEITRKLMSIGRLEKRLKNKTGEKPSAFSKQREALRKELSELRKGTEI